MEFLPRSVSNLRPLLVILILMMQGGGADSSIPDYEMLMEYERQRILPQQMATAIDDPADDLLVVRTSDEEGAKRVCGEYGYRFVRRVFDDDEYYLFQRSDSGRQRRSPEAFVRHSEIQWAYRQSPRNLVRRFPSLESHRITSGKRLLSKFEKILGRKADERRQSNSTPTFNDPLYREQWYLHNRGGSVPRNDINVLPVWQTGITGRGVAIAVLDDGVQAQSEEVAENYESAISEEYLFRNTSLRPIPENSHGTRCAAVAAGVANNGICGVGVAYEARIGGVRILDGALTDVQEALSLVHALDRVDIYTASWGPMDKGQAVDGPHILARMAFVKGVTLGRKGKGSIYVWAAGNGGGYSDNCSLDGYASSPFTLTIGALTEDGRSAFYSEPCPAVIASTYVGGRSHALPSEEDWLKDKARVKVVVPEGRGKCKETFQGTSAAAPMAAGVVALALQANPELTWRDVQHLIIRTSRVPTPPPLEPGWMTNAAGFHFHPKVGSGVLDAQALVEMARRWKSVGTLYVWTTPAETRTRSLPPRCRVSIRVTVLKSSMGGTRVDRLETVIATLSIRHARRGHLSATLRSPAGTTSRLLTRRPLDDNNGTSGFERWDFVSLHFWGEDPEGEWTLGVSNLHGTVAGFLDYFSVTLHGTGTTAADVLELEAG